MRISAMVPVFLLLPVLAGAAALPRADDFDISFAFRDPSRDPSLPIRQVAIQGDRESAAGNFTHLCGPTGDSCACVFYRDAMDPAPVRSAPLGISAQNNSVSCAIPASIPDARIRAGAPLYVMLKATHDSGINSGLISIQTTLSLPDLLGEDLSASQVAGIFKFTCSRTFFEGESVSANAVSCVAGQHLGVLSARYDFYLYESQTGNNLGSRGGDTPFPSAICSLNSFLQTQCSGDSPQLRYGLYQTQAGPFVVAVSLTPAPGQGGSLYGYAALPDSAGSCPSGLVKARPYVAQPPSLPLSGGTCPGSGCPSSFLNAQGILDNTVVEVEPPANFSVLRQPNRAPCDGAGDCSAAAFGSPVEAEQVGYSPLGPEICVIPPGLLSGLF